MWGGLDVRTGRWFRSKRRNLADRELGVSFDKPPILVFLVMGLVTNVATAASKITAEHFATWFATRA